MTTTPAVHALTATPAVHPVKGRVYALLVALQIASILAMIAWKGSVLVGDGPTVVLKTLPVDPRSLFMGDYVRLKLEISETAGVPVTEGPLVLGEAVWVVLAEGADGVWHPATIERARPPAGQASVAGLVEACEMVGGACTLHFGIEEFYVPEKRGLALEEAARHGTVLATVKLDGGGRAAILELHWPGDGTLPGEPPAEPAPFPEEPAPVPAEPAPL